MQDDIKNQIKRVLKRELAKPKRNGQIAFEAAIAESGIELDIKLFAIYFLTTSARSALMADNADQSSKSLR